MSTSVENLEKILYGDEMNIEHIVNKYQSLTPSEQDKAKTLLKSSLKSTQDTFDEFQQSYSNLKVFAQFQADLLNAMNGNPKNDEFTRQFSFSIVNPETSQALAEDFTTEEEDELRSDLIDENRGRGRTPLINDLIQHFKLTEKASDVEQEIDRIKNLDNVNSWYNIGTDRTPHQVIINATYLASIQFLEANSKTSNYSVLTRVMLNPSSLYFKGESVVIRNRYLDTYEEAMDYMQRQMEKVKKQFFYELAPSVIPNHGNRDSYYGFYLSKQNRSEYKNILQQVE